MPTIAEAAALLAPDKGVFGHHLGAEILETNGCFKYRN